MLGENLVGSGGSDCAAPSKQLSATEQAFNLARQNKNQLFEAIRFLEERLKPIIKQELPKGDCSVEKEAEEPVMLVAGIKEIAKDFGLATKRIKSLIERLEI